ncbi:hypothetical protein MMC13_007728 [Lambiella insularis]|nr:hypothetical protein [Lambiella insularis]
MEVSTALAPMDVDNMDIDIDLGPEYVEAAEYAYVPITSSDIQLTNSESPEKPSELTSEQTVPHKIHIRGVDDLTTNDIRAFSIGHYPSHSPLQIEWIDDTSANIVFENADIASEALASFGLQSDGDMVFLHSLQLRSAKQHPTHPGSNLQVRTAVSTDQKRPRAYQASRFYLMHPEHDPRERRRRASRTDGEHRSRRYGNDEQRRRRKHDAAEGFTASMYDDDAEAVATRKIVSDQRNSRSSFSSGTDSYRPKPSRDRSASPGQDTDDHRRARRRTPPPRYDSQDPHPFPRENRTKELFPHKAAALDVGAELRGISSNNKELFPNKSAAANLKKELFPLKAGAKVHRRSDAFDAADETADLFANGMAVPFVDGGSDRPSYNGRLKPSDPDPVAEDLEDLERGGFSIRGAAKQADKGFSIRGTATGASTKPAVKELFPVKAGNAGKELFAERLQGRGGTRNRADMFY